MANVLCVLYDDPVDGYPPAYARVEFPAIVRYPDGQSTPTPERTDFRPGALLGSVSGELGLRSFVEERGHEFVVTSDNDGADSVFAQKLPEAEIVISQPFWPAYLTADRIAKAPNLKLAITAGIGSDHVDLQAAIDRISLDQKVQFMRIAQVQADIDLVSAAFQALARKPEFAALAMNTNFAAALQDRGFAGAIARQ